MMHVDDNTVTTSARPRRWPGRLARLALWLVVLAAALLFVLGVAHMVLATAPEHLVGLEAWFWRFKYIGLTAQATAVALLVWRWDGAMRWAARQGLIAQSKLTQALAARRPALFVVVCILVVEGAMPGDLARLWQAFQGG